MTEYKIFTIKIDKENYDKFVEAANNDRRSLTNWIITTCIHQLEEEK